MRVKYIFSSRKSGRARDSPKMRKQRGKYPELAEKILKTSDILLEILDARFIFRTRNIEMEERAKKQNKKIIYVLNKSDLVKKTKKKEIDFCPYVLVSCKLRIGIRRLRELIKKESKKIIKENNKKNFEEKVSVGVIGYPNTGKSSLINLLIGKSSAGISADAGFTKGIQKLRLDENTILLDTPGVIPREEYSDSDEEKIARHTIVGSRSYSQIREPEIAVGNLMKEFGAVLEKYYKIDADKNSEILLETLGKKLNFLKKGGEVDFDKTARKILKDWQEGVIKV